MKNNEYEPQSNNWESLVFYLSPPTLVETLGYLKNNILEVLEVAENLSIEHRDMLLWAYHLIDEVQEHEFEN